MLIKLLRAVSYGKMDKLVRMSLMLKGASLGLDPTLYANNMIVTNALA
jgi:hypothetical protein